MYTGTDTYNLNGFIIIFFVYLQFSSVHYNIIFRRRGDDEYRWSDTRIRLQSAIGTVHTSALQQYPRADGTISTHGTETAVASRTCI